MRLLLLLLLLGSCSPSTPPKSHTKIDGLGDMWIVEHDGVEYVVVSVKERGKTVAVGITRK
jgi:hypothetical protein